MDLNKLKLLYKTVDNKSDFYKKTELDVSTISAILNGKTLPTVPTLEKMAKYFNVPVGYFFEDYEDNLNRLLKNNIPVFKKIQKIEDGILMFN